MRTDPNVSPVLRMVSIADISVAGWDGTAGADAFYVSHRWLRLVESDPTVEATYLAVFDADSVVAALPLYGPVDAAALGLEEPVDERLTAPLLAAGARRGYRASIVASDGDRGDRALAELLGDAETLAAECGATLVLPFLTSAAARRVVRCSPDARPMLTSVDTELSVPAGGLDEWVASLRAKRRNCVRRELRDFDGAGLELRVERLSGCCDEAAPLVGSLQRRHGQAETNDQVRASLRAQADALDDLTLALTARERGRLVGIVVFYRWGSVLYARFAGFDEARVAGRFAYFNLIFYRALDLAAQAGARTIHLGRGSYRAKLARGAAPTPLWTVVLPPDAGDRWRAANAVVRARLEAELGESLVVEHDWVAATPRSTGGVSPHPSRTRWR